MSLFLFKKAAVKKAGIAGAISDLLMFSPSQSIGSDRYIFDSAKNTYERKAGIALSTPPYSPAFSSDGKFVMLTHRSSPFVSLYRRESNGDYIRVALTGPLAGDPLAGESSWNGGSFSADGTYMYASEYNTMRITTWKRSEDGLRYEYFARSTEIAVQRNVAFSVSPDGQYAAVSSNYNNRIFLFKWDGTNFVYYNQINPGNSSAYPESFVWSKDSKFLFAAVGVRDYNLMIWRRDGDAFTLATRMNVNGDPRTVKLSPDESHIVLCGGNYTGQLIDIFKWNGTGGQLTSVLINSRPTTIVPNVSYSHDSMYLAVGDGSALGMTMYKRTNDSYAPIATNIVADNGLSSVLPLFRPVPE